MLKTAEQLLELSKLVRYYILLASTAAGSGHPTSSLSAADLMTYLFFQEFKFDLKKPARVDNDRLIFSKGHASPLFYALYAAAGVLTEKQLKRFRKLDSPLEGHPTPAFKYTEAPTGSLGQGLSIGVGLALNGKYLDKLPYRVFVLLGDGEMAEGSVWEAAQLAAYYKLDNLYGFLDVNRLAQSDPTMYGHNLKAYAVRLKSFGWAAATADGHNFQQIGKALNQLKRFKNKPKMLIARTIKGKGVKEIEDKNGWHGKALPKELSKKALVELGSVNKKLRGRVALPQEGQVESKTGQVKIKKIKKPIYKVGEEIATRRAYGQALAWYGAKLVEIVALDGDVKNSTYSEIFKEAHPERFFDMFIAEQNMVGAALGLARRGKLPFVSTFAAFLTRAYDQIRMAQYARASIKFVGSHGGVSIGEDGASQMGLEDLAMFRALYGSTIFYPADAVSTFKLVGEMIERKGIGYLRTTRLATPVIYKSTEQFPTGGSKVHRLKGQKLKVDRTASALVIGAGITLYEALAAQAQLIKRNVNITVIDAYSIKPLDAKTIRAEAKSLALVHGKKHIFVVEDHWFAGGLGDAVLNVFASGGPVSVHKLAVTKIPHSGKPQENLAVQGIDAKGIIRAIRKVL